jgi:hypothetical protein
MTPTHDDRAVQVRELASAFSAAILEHLGAVESRRGESDATVFAAYDRLRDAFTAYEDALYDAYDEVTPFEVVEVDDEDEDDDLDDEDDDLDEDDLDEDDLDEDDDLDDDELDVDELDDESQPAR